MTFYYLLSNFSYSSANPRYRFVLLQDVTIKVNGYYFGHATFLDQKGKIRLIVNGDTFTIFSGYAWDGASPKFSIGNYWVGTPDDPSNTLATLFHDCFCQFLPSGCLKVDKKTIDYIFYCIMRQNRFKLAYTYYKAVRIFGGIYHALKFFKRNKISCSNN